MKMPVISSAGNIHGKEVFSATFETEELKIVFTNIGASIVSLQTKDSSGVFHDIVLGFEDLHLYASNIDNYMGSVVGRCANRIRNGCFTWNDKTYQLAINNGSNHLHGGDAPFNTKVWDASFLADRAIFTLHSPDGEGNYPGNVDVTVTYVIHGNTLQVVYEGNTDQDTLLNVTNHTYFNLDGHDFGSLVHHRFQIDANEYVPIDESLIPIGNLCDVRDTPFDFRCTKPLLQDIDKEDIQLQRGNGYDHTFAIQGSAVLTSNRSNRYVKVSTNMPGMQLYTGNYLDTTGKDGAMYGFRSGVALETQYFPDSINQPNFVSALLRPNEKYEHITNYEFGVVEKRQ